MSTAERWRVAARRAGTHSLIFLPLVVVGWAIGVGWRANALAWDFTHAYLPAAHAVVHGQSPYALEAIQTEMTFVYPPIAAYLVAPFLILPLSAAQMAASLLSVAGIAGSLWLLRVRDWRCYAAALLWVSSYAVIHGANLTTLLVLGAAAVWRWRDRPVVTGMLTGLIVAAKLLAWPLLLFLLVTRRRLAAATALVAFGAFLLLPWAAIGFQGLGEYPHLLRLLADAERGDAYTLGALLAPLFGWPAGEAIAYLVGGLLLLALLKRRHEEPRAFVLALMAALVLSPIVWMDYFLFLAIVLGVTRPRFSVLWLLPIALWFGPQVGNGASWQTAFVLGLVAFVVTRAVSAGARERGPAEREQRREAGAAPSTALEPPPAATAATGLV